jgi:hypothetical protein
VASALSAPDALPVAQAVPLLRLVDALGGASSGRLLKATALRSLKRELADHQAAAQQRHRTTGDDAGTEDATEGSALGSFALGPLAGLGDLSDPLRREALWHLRSLVL